MSTGARRIAVTGAGGFLGAALVRSLRADGIDVHPVVRRAPRSGEIGWDPVAGTIDRAAFEGVDQVVHLAGESINGYWSASRKRRIRESRERGTHLLATTLRELDSPPRTLVSASGVGYYGDAGETVLDESAPAGEDFLARVCVAWEEGTRPAHEAGVRVVRTRFGLVLDRSGGALALMLPPFWFGVGAKLGSGRQWMSWIALVDAIRVLRFALDSEDLEGPLNACAPEPVRNEDFTRTVARAVRRPAFLRVPAPVLRAVTGGMADALLLSSQRAVPARLSAAGFRFAAPTLDRVLDAVPAGAG